VTESPLLNSWIQEATDRAQLEMGREWLITCLTIRFPEELTPEVIDTINQQSSSAQLRSWHRSAAGAKTYDEFLAALRQCQRERESDSPPLVDRQPGAEAPPQRRDPPIIGRGEYGQVAQPR
jgi:hypothetical protein